ncbi:MAG TPA: 2-hydroxychromene-2-carboxylate isomerase [Polyangiaceae bacterium]|jgi:2-hydroxychromene-2-carboxylate isomerase
MAAPIAFHFDFISPYAYLAWTQIHALAEKYGPEVAPVPTLLAPLLAHGATKGPAEIPAKRMYMFFDVLRSAHVLGVTIAPPSSHPFNPLVALRAASLDMTAAEKRRLVDVLYAAVWVNGHGVETPEKVAAIATRAGLDGEEIVRRASEQSAKDRLRKQTDDAIGAGVFGVPTMIADGEMFWGVDSLPHLERFLRGELFDARAKLREWSAVGATASRKS